jgi:hypothetical protein
MELSFHGADSGRAGGGGVVDAMIEKPSIGG